MASFASCLPRVRARISINVKPGSKRPGVEVRAEGVVLRVRERAIEGAANEAVIRALSGYLQRPRSAITLAKGAQARHKLIDIDGMSVDEVLSALRDASTEDR